MEIKLMYSKGYSNSIYMIFNISNLSKVKHLFYKTTVWLDEVKVQMTEYK